MKSSKTVVVCIAMTLFVICSHVARAQEFTLYNFGSPGCSAQPDSAPVFDTKGNIYGTCQDSTNGYVYELSPNGSGGWAEQTIYTFGSSSATATGSGPNGLIFDAQKVNLYGTTSAGGADGAGVVFELSPGSAGGWTETVLYSFGANGANDGNAPTGGLVFDTAGNLYGTTTGGGTGFNSGTVFELTPKTGGGWTEATLHSFTFLDSNGDNPKNGLVFDAKGNLYGTTSSNAGGGTVFQLAPATGGVWNLLTLASFASSPVGTIVIDTTGNLYGACSGGGTNSAGFVYEVSPATGGTWTSQVLYSFGQTSTDGTTPAAGVVLGPKGVLYGTTGTGGLYSGTSAPSGYGTIYQLTPGTGTWTEKVLYNFDDKSDNDGYNPQTDLGLDAAGNLFGNSSGGTNAEGVVFELTSPTAVELPQFSPEPGTYILTQSVEITDPTPNTTIYYTTNGTSPTTASTKYTGAITVSATETIEAIGVAAGLSNSQLATAKYIITPPAATPVFSPVAGTYATAQSVTISDATAGATIYFTTNGTTPTTGSTKYTVAISVSATETIEAIAIATGYSLSDVAAATYTIETPAAIPVISPAAGTYIVAQSVTITDVTPGAVIYYTTNGTAPTSASMKYTGAITVSATETIEAIAVATGYTNSSVAVAKYVITPPAALPTFSPVAGTYAVAQKVSITDANAGATIYYTTNGTSPTTASTKYSGAITVSTTETIKAIAIATGYSVSAVASAAYTIETPAATPVFSPAAGSYVGTQKVTITDTTTGASTYYTTNGTAPTTASTKYTGAITVSASETIEAIATAPGYTSSAIATAKYAITQLAATPVFSPAAGTYSVAQLVTITDGTSGASIYYTTDGTTPTASSTKYTGPVLVPATETIQAISVAAGFGNSAVGAATYAITTAQGWQEKVLYSFGASTTDGRGPIAGLVLDAKGNLYGTTNIGGSHGFGTAIELSPATGGGWTEQILYNFGATSTDASSPAAPLIFDAKGNLYGTTASGGIYGVGAVFELSPDAGGGWSEKVLYSFGATATDGRNPQGAVVFDSKGNMYGTTENGGAYATSTSPGGTFYELTQGTSGSWTESFRYSFGATSNDGMYPTGGLIFDAKGNLYGTNNTSGKYGTCCGSGGTVFEFSPATGGGWTEQVLHSFGQSGDGNAPQAGLVFDSKGNLYGTTSSGGVGVGSTSNPFIGTVFELSPVTGGGWTEKLLYSFAPPLGGFSPNGNLILDAKGNLYGTTLFGGTIPWGTSYNPMGTVFELSPSSTGVWRETALYSFGGSGDIGTTNSPSNDGINPASEVGLVMDAKGNLYGTNRYSGGHGNVDSIDGTVFEIESLTVATPVFSPVAGTYGAGQTITIADATPGATIYYTTNGANPTTSSTKYSAPITLSAAETIKAIAIDTVYTNSSIATASYAIGTPAVTPVISPAAGTYPAAQTITITDGTSGATIYYSTNGATPTTASTKYTAAFKLTASATVKAIAIASGYAQSAVASSAYTIETPAATPVFSPVAGTYTAAQSIKITDSTTGATIYYATDGTTPTSSSTKYTVPISVSQTTTIKAIAVAAGYFQSAVASATYTIAPLITLTPTALAFPTTALGATSATQTVTLANKGLVSAALTSITITGTNPTSFKQLNNCPASIVAGASCTAFVAFHPASTGINGATLSIADNATGSPQTVALSGTGSALDTVKLSVTSLTFASTKVGVTSVAQSVTLTNAGAAILNIGSIAITGTNSSSFSQVSTCGPTLAPAADCLIYVAFKPTVTGALTGNLTITDSGSGSPQTVKLAGTGAS